MTEAEWLVCDDPILMLGLVKDGVTERKMRLFALACCRRTESLLVPDRVPHCRRAIAVLESRIEGLVSEHDLQTALGDAHLDAIGEVRHPGDTAGYARSTGASVFWYVLRFAWEGVATAASHVLAYDALTRSGNPDLERVVAFWSVRNPLQGDTRWRSDEDAVQALPEYVLALRVEQRTQTHILRDIFGNPFRPVSFSPEWRTDTATAIARQMYESRDFGAMPILADALQDAGCDSDDILAHCRDANQSHVRGCWVVDLVLGKT